MINLLNLMNPEIDGGTPGLRADGGETAGDFLSLLAGALGAENPEGEKSLPPLAREAKSSAPPATSLTEWLLQQEAMRLPLDTATAPDDTKTLLTQLASHLKSNLQDDAPAIGDDDAPTVSDNTLAGLSALLAMLPATQPSAQPTPPVNGVTDSPDGLAPRSHAKGELAALTRDSAPALSAAPQAAFAQNASQPVPDALTVKADSTLTAAPATAALAPVISAPSPLPKALPAAPVHAPLGSPDWQQSVSQHITLFTRQGQQSAELRLHPEDLGQVHISLKLDDNQAQIQLVSPHSHVRAALEAALPMLRTQLAESGIQLGQSSISSESSAGQQQQHAAGQQSTWHSAASGDDDEEVLPVPAALHTAARGDGAVDIFA